MKKANIPGVQEQLDALKKMSDDDIDYSDIPPITDFNDAVRGKFYRPVKRSVTLRLDADILDWFKRNNDKYQTAINVALRQYIQAQR